MEPNIPISVIILTHNEEANIRDCLESLQGWISQIIVVDSGSTDSTREIVKEYTDQIYHHPFENYSLQRNWAQENLPIQHEWILHLDADERCTPQFWISLKEFFEDPALVEQFSGLLIRRMIEFMGRNIRYGGLYPTYHCRIFKKNRGWCELRDYDQHFMVDGLVKKLPVDIIEVTATSLESWTSRHNRWAQMESKYLVQKKNGFQSGSLQPKFRGTPIERRRWFRVSILESAPLFLRALVYFIYRYILRGGFLDGKEGLIYHVLHGFWFRFYVDACIFELNKNIDK